MSLHRHKKHWLFHASMWVCAFCVLLAFGFVSWKFHYENKSLNQEVNRLMAESGNMKAELSSCSKKKTVLEKSVEGILEEKTHTTDGQFSLINNSCNEDACLFKENNEGYVAGIGLIKGYLTKDVVIMAHGNGEKTSCFKFVVTGGTDILVNYFKGLADSKYEDSYVYDKQGKMVIAVDPARVTLAEQNKLKRSSEKSPVELSVVRKIFDGQNYLCDPFIGILNVK